MLRELGADERAVYDSVSRECAAELASLASPSDVVVAHDPQPLGMAAIALRTLGTRFVWRRHIGNDEDNAATRAA